MFALEIPDSISHKITFPQRNAPESFSQTIVPRKTEGEGMPGARRTHSLACENRKAHEYSRHRSTGVTRHSRAMVLTVSFVLSPVIGLFCHRRRRSYLHRSLDASVEASGPHDFAVRVARLSSESAPASTASRPASVTIASRPCLRDGTGRGCRR